MRSLIVNTPSGVQQLLEVDVQDDQPAYFDYSRVVWDTANDGALPDNGVQIGGMQRIETAGVASLQFNANLKTQDDAADLAQRQAAAWDAIRAERDRLSTDGGFKVAVGGADKWFHSDERSRGQQLGLVRKADRIQAAAGDMTAQFAGNSGLWKTMDGSFVVMTGDLAHAIADASELQEGAIFAAAETHRQAMLQAADPGAYDYSAGWPAVYQAPFA